MIKLYWTSEGQERTVKKFVAVEGESVKLESIDFELFSYTHKDETVFIVEKSSGTSISNGKTLNEAIEGINTIVEKQGRFDINERIKIHMKDARKVPNEPPSHKDQFVEIKNIWNEDLGTNTKILVYHE